MHHIGPLRPPLHLNHTSGQRAAILPGRLVLERKAVRLQRRRTCRRTFRPAARSRPAAPALTLPGVDVATAEAVLAAWGDTKRFPDGDHAASYLGLASSLFASVWLLHPEGRLTQNRPNKFHLNPEPRQSSPGSGFQPVLCLETGLNARDSQQPQVNAPERRMRSVPRPALATGLGASHSMAAAVPLDPAALSRHGGGEQSAGRFA